MVGGRGPAGPVLEHRTGPEAGSRDSVFPIEKMEAFYRSVRKAAPGYPIRMVRFETGSHGTPIRMTDWRETINWMLAQ